LRLKLIFPDLGHFPLLYRRYIPVMSPAIIAGLTPPDVEVSFTDERVRPVDTEEDCDLVAISVKTPQASRAYALADEFRARGIPVVLGGVHVSMMPEEARLHADAIVVGEAEGTWPQVMEDFRKGSLQREYRCGQVTEKLPTPRWDIFSKDIYMPLNSVQVSRGCPVNCDMCSVPQAFGTQFRMFDTDDILRQVETLAPYLFLINDNLHLAKRRVRPFLEGMAGMGKQWVGMAPLSFARDDEYLKLIQRSNCWAMYIDLSPWVSASLNDVIEDVEAKRTAEFINKIHDHGIKVIASFVFGFDHDKPDIFDRTVAFAHAHGIEESEFHILTPYPGSRLYARLEGEGRLLSTRFADYPAGKAVFSPRHMSPEELQEGYLRAWRKFYVDSAMEETDEGPVVKSYAGFPMDAEEGILKESGEWVGAVLPSEGINKC
jgi:radical SAM superfamily enzyme YgiQ (UPF0313 family)